VGRRGSVGATRVEVSAGVGYDLPVAYVVVLGWAGVAAAHDCEYAHEGGGQQEYDQFHACTVVVGLDKSKLMLFN
jgi:hypothetical protein